MDNAMDESPPTNLAAIIVPIVFSFIFVLGVIGNTLVVVVLSKTYKNGPKGLNSTNRFILNLAIADMLFLLFCVPFQAPIYSMPGWPFGPFMCVFCEVCQMTFMLASIYTMVALSLDRYFAIVYATSTKQFRTSTNATICLVGIWTLSIGLGAAAVKTRSLYGMQEIADILSVEFPDTTTPRPEIESTFRYENYNTTEPYTNTTAVIDDYTATDENSELCIPTIETKEFQKIYKVVILVLGYIVPLLLIFLCYVGVIRAMTKNVKNVATLSNKVNQRRSQEAKKRVTKIVVLVVIFFAIHWFPYHVTELWLSYGDYEFTKASYAFIIIAHCLSYANSCVNPLIYAFMSRRIRGDLKKFFCCQQCSKTLVNMKICSKNIVSSYNVDLKKPDGFNNEREYHPRSVTDQQHKQGFKPVNNFKCQPAANSTVVYAQEDSCLTFLTSLTPSPCHRGQCSSSSASFNFNNQLPACSEDIFAEECENDFELQNKSCQIQQKTENSKDTTFSIKEGLQLHVENMTPEHLLLNEPSSFAYNGGLQSLHEDKYKRISKKKGRQINDMLAKNNTAAEEEKIDSPLIAKQ